MPDQVIINVYKGSESQCPAGSGISPHFDNKEHYEREIGTLSLQSEAQLQMGLPGSFTFNGAPMTFTGTHQIPLPVRSLTVMAHDAADKYQHGISALTQPRVSLTFRKVILHRVQHDQHFQGPHNHPTKRSTPSALGGDNAGLWNDDSPDLTMYEGSSSGDIIRSFVNDDGTLGPKTIEGRLETVEWMRHISTGSMLALVNKALPAPSNYMLLDISMQP